MLHGSPDIVACGSNGRPTDPVDSLHRSTAQTPGAASSDGGLVRRTLAGDPDGFGELHRRYYARVVGVVTGILKDRGRAEEEVQEAYLTALESLPRLADRDRFYPWLRRIAVNRAIEAMRRTRRRERIRAEHAGGAEDHGAGDALDEIIRVEAGHRVRAALDRLPERQRAAVVLRFFDGLPMREIAEILGCEPVTARTQVFRGLQRLGTLMREEDR